MTGRRRDKGKQVAREDARAPVRGLVDEDETQPPSPETEQRLSLPPELVATQLGGPSGVAAAHTSSSRAPGDLALDRIHISPRGREFSAQSICARRIGKIVEQKFSGPWKSWKAVPIDRRDFWFSQFELYFTWDEDQRSEIRRVFEHVGSNVLKNRLYDAKTANTRPLWISEAVWAALLLEWSLSTYKTVCERNKKNRSSDCGGQGFPLHVGGSITHLTHMDRLKAKYGREVTVSELFMETHSRLNSKGEREWSDAHSQARHGSYVQAHEQPGEDAASSEAQPSMQVQIDRWAEMAGGKKKGRVFGLAGLASQVLGTSSSKGPTQRERQLQSELSSVADELTQVKEHLRAQSLKVEEMSAQMAAFEEIKAQMLSFMSRPQSNFGASPSFPSTTSSLPFPSTVAPRPRGRSLPRTVATPVQPPHDPADASPPDSDAE